MPQQRCVVLVHNSVHLAFSSKIIILQSKPVIDRIPLRWDNSTYGHDGHIEGILASARIVNGSTATVNQFPWFVAVRAYTSRGLKSICGGSLISKSWVSDHDHCPHR